MSEKPQYLPIDPSLCELEGPYECPHCGGHISFDGTYLDQVTDEGLICPYCHKSASVPESAAEPQQVPSKDWTQLTLLAVGLSRHDFRFEDNGNGTLKVWNNTYLVEDRVIASVAELEQLAKQYGVQ